MGVFITGNISTNKSGKRERGRITNAYKLVKFSDRKTGWGRGVLTHTNGRLERHWDIKIYKYVQRQIFSEGWRVRKQQQKDR